MAYFKCGQLYVTANSAASNYTASGAIANFDTQLAMPMSLKAYIEATQASGTPTPSTPLPIGGWDSVKVVKAGANLWDETWENGTYSINTGEPIDYTTGQIRSKTTFEVPSNASLKIVFTNPSVWVFFYDENDNLINTPISGVTQSGNAYSIPKDTAFITPVNAKKCKFYCNASYGDTYNNDLCFCSSNDSTYHAHNPNSEEVIIPLGQTVYGGYVTQDKDGHRELVATSIRKVFDNTANWTLYEEGNLTNVYRAQYVVTNEERPKSETNQLFNIGVLNSYAFRADDSRMNTCVLGTSRSLYAQISKANFPSADAFKTFLETTPLQVCYELNTPIIIPLPDGLPLNALIGTNNLFADSGDSEVIYTRIGAPVMMSLNLNLNSINSEEPPIEEPEDT